MGRVTLADSIEDVFVKMSDGNPGCLTVLCQMLKYGADIDPDCWFPLIQILSMDDDGIYGSRVWMLYKDVCKMNLAHTFGLLRARQLGIVSKAQLDHAIDNMGEGVDLEATLVSVSERLPNFNSVWEPGPPAT